MGFDTGVEIVFNCSQEAAYNWLWDLEKNLSKYSSDFPEGSTKKTNDLTGVGAQWICYGQQLKHVDEDDLEGDEKKLKDGAKTICVITEAQPFSHYIMKSDIIGLGDTVEDFSFTPLEGGKTKCVIKAHAQFKGLAKLGTPFIKYMMKKYYAEMKGTIEKMSF